MSRIDEALKRVSPGAATERTPSRSESVLDHYPQENRFQPPIAPSGARPAAPRPVAPRPEPPKPRLPSSPEAAAKLVVAHHAPAVFVEQYRRLAATVHDLQQESGLNTLLVTSAVPKEGKTLTIVNLALTLSESYDRRVLLIDADLRRPTVHQVLELSNATGLTDVLKSDGGTLPTQQLTRNLTVLPAGNPTSNPMAGLTSDRMRAVLRDASVAFDWVLLDAPPVGIMPDAGILAGMTGGSLLVIGAGSTPHAMVERAVTELGRERILGIVLNRIADENIPATGYYDDYYGPSSDR